MKGILLLAALAGGTDSPSAALLKELLAREARVARQELELARAGTFYYVLDIPGRALRFKLRGVELKSFPLKSVELGATRGGPSHPGWPDRIHALAPPPLPERPEILPAPSEEDSSAASTVRSSKEEKEKKLPPVSFTMDAGPSLSLRIVSDHSAGSLLAFLAERLAALREPRGKLRLRLRLADDDARALYQSWPASGKLILIPPLQGS